MPDQQDFVQLVERYVRGLMSVQEKEAFFQLFTEKDLDPALDEFLWRNYQQHLETQVWPDEFRHLFANRLTAKIISAAGSSPELLAPVLQLDNVGKQTPDKVKSSSVRHDRLSGPRFFRYAAAILLLVGATVMTIVVFSDRQSRVPKNDYHKPVAKADVAPGGQRALLTLADGSIIVLDSAANGQLANQGGAKVIKLANGQIAYDLRGMSAKEVVWNTMTTPKGGQYQVTLPDGTNVWLNASSSIKFPTAFVGNKREVKIYGEIYFEVTRNKAKPFIVDIDGRSSVEVLGTRFNINSYANEGDIKTTLLAGSVRVFNIPGGTPNESVNHQPKRPGSQPNDSLSIVLKPGQQALQTGIGVTANSQSLKGSGISILNDIDLDQAIAWKNGIFNFDGAGLHSVMRQLERWYDIKVQYRSSISNVIFKGKMYRNVNLSDVLDMLRKMGVRFDLEGKSLVVL